MIKAQIQALKSNFPGVSIRTDVKLGDGLAVMRVEAVLDGNPIASVCRLYRTSCIDAPVSSIDVIEDLLIVLGIDNAEDGDGENETDITDTQAVAGNEASSATPTSIPAPSAEAENSDGGAQPEPVPEPPNEPPKRQRQRKASGPKSNKGGENPSDGAILEARAVVLEFLPEITPPISLRQVGGKTLGELVDKNQAVVRYLTQPGGKAYVTEKVANAAALLYKKK